MDADAGGLLARPARRGSSLDVDMAAKRYARICFIPIMADIKATFRVVGALTRSTVGGEPAHPLEDALYWIWSWRLQVSRLRTTTSAQGQGDTDIERRRSYSCASFDEHMLAVTGWNLARALSSATPYLPEASVAQHSHDALRFST